MSAIASALVCALKFVNWFARHQHLFDIAATSINIDSNIPSYPVRLSLLQFRPKCNHLIYSWYLRQISSKSVKYSCEAKETPIESGKDRSCDRIWGWQGKNIMPPLQHTLRRHKNPNSLIAVLQCLLLDVVDCRRYHSPGDNGRNTNPKFRRNIDPNPNFYPNSNPTPKLS